MYFIWHLEIQVGCHCKKKFYHRKNKFKKYFSLKLEIWSIQILTNFKFFVRIGNPRRPPLPSFKKQSYLIVMAPVTLYGNMNENEEPDESLQAWSMDFIKRKFKQWWSTIQTNCQQTCLEYLMLTSTVKSVYKMHSGEHENVPFMSRCPLYAG